MKKGLTIIFDEEEKRQLEAVSFSTSKSQSKLIKEAVRQLIAKYKNGPKNLIEATKYMKGLFADEGIDNVREESNKGLIRGRKL
ncbi:MAG: hypothetical protein WCI43_01865 [Candidatus Firestonebacteria bacterium]